VEALARGASVNTRRVVITGSESTGKTTLARDLGAHFGAPWVPEFARDYADAQTLAGRKLDETDVEPIARGTIERQDAALGGDTEIVFFDTDLVSTVVYARHYYGACPSWIETAARNRLGDLYLLCDTDVPWIPDSVRDIPHQRAYMHALFVEQLTSLGARVVTIRGSWEGRIRLAAETVSARYSGCQEDR
jgi:NadR type nicotinamide-nucleotide adenylyltransferase